MDVLSNIPEYIRTRNIESFEDANHVSSDVEDFSFSTESFQINVGDQNTYPRKHRTNRENSIFPYQSIYFSSNIILPINNFKIKIFSYERFTTSFRTNRNVYLIAVEYQNSKWNIRRSYGQFQRLNNQLTLLRTTLNIPFPSRTQRERRTSFKAEIDKGKSKQIIIPQFPLLPDALVSVEQMEMRILQLENYLNAILENAVYRNHSETLNFFEISQMSFIDQLGIKRKEGLMKKHHGDELSAKYNIYCKEEDGQAGCCLHIVFCKRFQMSGFWRKRWIFIKDSFFGYLRPLKNEIRCILLMDQEFQVRSGYSETGMNCGIVVSNSSRQLIIKSSTNLERIEWVDYIRHVMETTGSDFVQLKRIARFKSFVPVRKSMNCSWFVDGANFLSVVADAIENAKEEIMIAGWWLSPEIYMKRPIIDGNTWRLDTLLRRKAEEGVRVFVLLYKEVELALGINSLYSKKVLSLLHANIKVLRHPDHIAGTGTLLWAHHEKLVIIDQSTSFVSGIDLCYGRWDDEKHRLTDLGSASFSNHIVSTNTSSHTKGQQKSGAIFHFAKTTKQVTVGTLNTNNEEKKPINKKNENAINTQNVHEDSTKFWIGKDYTNFIVKDSNRLDEPFTDSVDRTTTPRMPWHDIGCMVFGKAARDVARHFIQRWNAAKVEKVKGNTDFPFLVPKSYGHFDPYIKGNQITTSVNCQVLRSSSTWSVGSRITEDSIHSAYIYAIENSKHFIYIENQFFITISGDSGVSNRIGEVLYNRIILASENQSRFRVVVVLPLLPGFEGQIGTKSGIAMHAIMHWNYASISRGKKSLLERLRAANIDPTKYITFYGLRSHSQLNQQLVTELIYVHSKLMIVDDKLVICGSANINDRSLLGKRDSEIALIIEDNSFVESLMDGKLYFAGKFAFSLRKRLFREHLGLLNMKCESELDIRDPISDSFYRDNWIRIAALNTKIYEEVFRCLPCDEVTTFDALSEFQSVLPLSLTDPVVARHKLKKIQGNIVLFPLNFMSQENLTPISGTPESLMPMYLWT